MVCWLHCLRPVARKKHHGGWCGGGRLLTSGQLGERKRERGGEGEGETAS